MNDQGALFLSEFWNIPINSPAMQLVLLTCWKGQQWAEMMMREEKSFKFA